MVGTDLFELKGQQYLVVVDYYSRYSRYPECIKLSELPLLISYRFYKQFLLDMEFRKPYVATMVLNSLHMCSRDFLKRMGLNT